MVRLRSTRTDQAAYAQVARVIAIRVAALLLKMAPDEKAGAKDDGDARKRGIALWLAGESEVEQEFPVAGLGQSRLLEDGSDGYRVFTRAYDREIDASTLARAAVLADLRHKLDEEVARAGVNVGRLARHLQAFFAIPIDDGWNSSQEEGRIDGRLLSQLVASPTERRLFKQVRREPLADCAVTFLLDCSGSMKQHGVRLAVLIDVFTRALELAGVMTEVLGFTTNAWNGGLARRDWLRAGSPAHPGRLNEALHVVFKAAQAPWRRRRRDIAALLKNEFYREGIDGEAVDWACGRLRAVEARRRLLVVVSDGSPMDGATALANDAHYLDHHLQHVVAQQSAVGDVEITGLGVGLDLSPYYTRSRVIDLAQGVGLRTFIEVSGLMAGRRA
jgi:cobaltochelatase CobT